LARKGRKIHKDQLSFFSDNNVIKSKIVQDILKLDFIEAHKEIVKFKELFPSERLLKAESFICDFFAAFTLQDQEEHITALWNEFEREFKKSSLRCAFFNKLKENYFSALCHKIEKNQYITHYINPHAPTGLLYILAGKFDKAIQELGRAIEHHKKDSQLFGYLADTYYLKGYSERARICYREAFEIDPQGIDINFLKDPAVADLIDFVKSERNEDNEYLTWIVSYGCVERVFPFKYYSESASLQPYVREFFSLNDKYNKNITRDIMGKLFYYSLLLSENQNILSSFEEIDLSRIRSLMRELNPLLFSSYLALKAIDE
jgi:tetratricopeptide (TPR) repeat protein